LGYKFFNIVAAMPPEGSNAVSSTPIRNLVFM